MSKLNILVVEDEAIIAMHLCEVLEDLGYEPMGTVDNYEDAVEVISQSQPHLVLLDIMLGGEKTGIDIASFIRKNGPNIPFIFLTSHADRKTVEAAKKTQPNGYLVKPFRGEDVYTAIEMAVLNFGGKLETHGKELPRLIDDEDGFFIKEDHVFIKVKFGDICWIESAKNYLIIHTNLDSHKIRATFSEIIAKLPQAEFFRIHKSYLVNLLKITSSNKDVLVINEKILPIARGKWKELASRLSFEL